MFPCIHPRVTGIRYLLGLVSVLLFSLVLLTGCGGGEKGSKSVVLAKVGDTDITSEMYEKGLAKMEANELPMGEFNQPVDTSVTEGKQEFLKVLIHKELLRQKAVQLGYAQDPQAVVARKSLLDYHGVLALWDDVVGDPSSTISEEELQAFYAKMSSVRNCQFVICNFLEDAEKARDFARTGADWDEVVDRFHDGVPAPNGIYEIKVPFGQYSPEFEGGIFDVSIGEVADPARTSYGYWVMRVLDEKQGPRPDLEEAKAKILDVVRNRKLGKVRKEFREQMHKDHKLFIDDDVLWICYLGLPEGGLMDPETNQPRAKDTLDPLNVPLAELDRLFYSYELNGELQENTLGDYKGHFDNMSVFQRPKRSDMLGGLREHIIKELERGLAQEEAEKRGFFEDPEVVYLVDEKVEEIMVTQLYDDVVQFDDRVTEEDINLFYEEHKADYDMPESRSGRMVVCLNEESAAKAKADFEQGKPWNSILKEYGVDRDNKSRGGKLLGVSAKGSGPVKEAIFGLEIDQLSEPFLVNNGRYGVVKLESIKPAGQMEKSEVLGQLGQRIRNLRKEEAFQTLLDEWQAEFGVTIFEENLSGLPSWEELHTREVPENLVPRN